MIAGFSEESLNAVWDLLYAEEDLEGTCDQKKRLKSVSKPRTPAQKEADKIRSQANRGKDQTSSTVRSNAAKKAAETRRRCKGLPANPSPSTTK
jgi:hypothetical protein